MRVFGCSLIFGSPGRAILSKSHKMLALSARRSLAMSSPAKSTPVIFGKKTFSFPSEPIGDMKDCNDILRQKASPVQKSELLRQRLTSQGYLLVRGLIPSDVVNQGKATVASYLSRAGLTQAQDVDKMTISTGSGASTFQGKLMGDGLALPKQPTIKRIIEGKELREFFELMLGGEVLTYDYKWLRTVKPGESSGAHMDSVYMGRGSGLVHTCWIPFMDIPVTLGGLAVFEQSNHAPGFERLRRTYGEMDVDRDDVAGTGWFSEDPEEVARYADGVGQWVTTNYRAGDVVIFTLKTMHASLDNQTNRYRVSCDVRWQLKSEPVDDRWMGEPPKMHTKFTPENQYNPKVYPITMQQAKQGWGLTR